MLLLINVLSFQTTEAKHTCLMMLTAHLLLNCLAIVLGHRHIDQGPDHLESGREMNGVQLTEMDHLIETEIEILMQKFVFSFQIFLMMYAGKM